MKVNDLLVGANRIDFVGGVKITDFAGGENTLPPQIGSLASLGLALGLALGEIEVEGLRLGLALREMLAEGLTLGL